MNSEQGAPVFFEDQPFATEERGLLRRLKATGFEARSIFDIGAASGSWSQLVSRVFPGAEYHLFEPLAGRFPEYDRKLGAALRSQSNFRMHGVALSDTGGTRWFWVGPSGLGSSLVNASEHGDECIEVESARLDEYVAQHELRQPQVIKADVQAAELMVIRGGVRTFSGADVLILETHLEPSYGEGSPLITDLVRELSPLGFRLVEFGGVWRPESRAIVSVDGFFLHDRLIARLPAGRRTPAQRVAEALGTARERGRTRAALYGAGQHTAGIARELDTMPLPIVAVIDDDPRARAARITGRPVIAKDSAASMGIDVVVLSSDVHEQELWEASAELRARGIEVVRLYAGAA